MVSKLNVYENVFMIAFNDPSMTEMRAHRRAMRSAELSETGLGHARHYANKKMSAKPGVLFQRGSEKETAAPPPRRNGHGPPIPMAARAHVSAAIEAMGAGDRHLAAKSLTQAKRAGASIAAIEHAGFRTGA